MKKLLLIPFILLAACSPKDKVLARKLKDKDTKIFVLTDTEGNVYVAKYCGMGNDNWELKTLISAVEQSK